MTDIVTAAPRIPLTFVGPDTDIRAFDINGEPWFVLADICRALAIMNPSDAAQGIDPDALDSTEAVDRMGRNQRVRIVNEAGMYELVFVSRKPNARAFRRWVTSEVIPSIRKTGSYVSTPQTMVEALRLAADSLEREEAAKARVRELEPVAAFAEAAMLAHGDYDVRTAAQVLARDPGISIGQRRLFGYLRTAGWLDAHNVPYQRQIDTGRLAVRCSTVTVSNGQSVVTQQARVTMRGLVELHRMLGGTRPLVVQGELT